MLLTGHVNIRQNNYCGKLSSQQDSPLRWMWHLTNLSLYLPGTASTRKVCPAMRRANHDTHSAVCLYDLWNHHQHSGKTDLQCVGLLPTMYNSFLCLLNEDVGVWPGLHRTKFHYNVDRKAPVAHQHQTTSQVSSGTAWLQQEVMQQRHTMFLHVFHLHYSMVLC
jgi:hypothetical protein